jgi:hypothetical protein
MCHICIYIHPFTSLCWFIVYPSVYAYVYAYVCSSVLRLLPLYLFVPLSAYSLSISIFVYQFKGALYFCLWIHRANRYTYNSMFIC